MGSAKVVADLVREGVLRFLKVDRARRAIKTSRRRAILFRPRGEPGLRRALSGPRW